MVFTDILAKDIIDEIKSLITIRGFLRFLFFENILHQATFSDILYELL